MDILTTNLILLSDRLVAETERNPSSISLAQSMSSRHVCLCCSNALLRHIRLGKLYWRCNHCYQAMPIIEDAKERPLFVACEALFQQLLISRKPLCDQRNFDHEGCERSAHNLAITSIVVHSG